MPEQSLNLPIGAESQRIHDGGAQETHYPMARRWHGIEGYCVPLRRRKKRGQLTGFAGLVARLDSIQIPAQVSAQISAQISAQNPAQISPLAAAVHRHVAMAGVLLGVVGNRAELELSIGGRCERRAMVR